jgi:hypothetical protein
MIIKAKPTDFSRWDFTGWLNCIDFYIPLYMQDKIWAVKDNDITFCVKVGKKRVMLNGKTMIRWEYPRNGMPYTSMITFWPNNVKKAKKALNKGN